MRASRAAMAFFLAYTTAVLPLSAQSNIISNGKSSGITTAGFLFEPEVPLVSLKYMPTWNELEQLLDNPSGLLRLCAGLPGVVGNTPGTEQGFPSVCTGPAFVRRPSFGVTLPPLIVNPLNYNPTSGEQMRLINPNYPGGNFSFRELSVTYYPLEFGVGGVISAPGVPGFPPGTIPDGVSPTPVTGFVDPLIVPSCPTVPQLTAMANGNARFNVGGANLGTGVKTLTGITAGSARVTAEEPHAIDYNSPINVGGEPFTCVPNVEVPEIGFLLGRDPGEPSGYSVPAVRTGTAGINFDLVPVVGKVLGALGPLVDPATGAAIGPRSTTTGVGGLKKPSLRVPPYGTPSAPGYLVNAAPAAPNNVAPSNENDYVINRDEAIALGKSLFWDMQVGSDGVQSCGSCHAHAGADNRVKNQMNPNHLHVPVSDHNFEIKPPNGTLTVADFPFIKLKNPEISGDPKCSPALSATVNAGVLEHGAAGVTTTVCDAANVISSSNDVASSMGVHFGRFMDIPAIGTFSTNAAGVQAVVPDLRSTVALDNVDPIAGFQGASPVGTVAQFRRVEPRNTPTVFMAGVNFDNFWDGRARHDFNGGSVFGAADPQLHVFVNNGTGLTPTRQIIRFASLGSLATGPGLSEFEMSLLGRNWSKIGKKLLQAGITPLANQLVDPTDSVLGRYSNQGGSACAGVAAADKSPGSPASGKPGLCISYQGLIRRAYYPALWQNTSGAHLNGCYTDGRADIHTPQCATGVNDPFDGYVLTPAAGAAAPADTNQFTQMEGNFSLFWGLSVNLWASILIPDNTPFDQFLDANPDAFMALGEPGERGLVQDLLNCTSATQRGCFREVGLFKRDQGVQALINTTGENGTGGTLVPAGGTRTPNSNEPDPLLGMDIFFASNLSLKNTNFRTARCGECHASPTLTDNTMPFTFKAQLRDFVSEFPAGQPGVEAILEPLGRNRIISGFLLESEMNENGQDGVERRIANQSIVPNPVNGLAYPDGLLNPSGSVNYDNPAIVTDARYTGAGAGYFDNGVYNLGVTVCNAGQGHDSVVDCDDVGRGGDDAFGWPLSLAALMLKNMGGPGQEPGTPVPTFNPSARAECAPECADGGLFEESPQDEQINPGFGGALVNPLLPGHLAPWVNEINVGDSQPELDEIFSGINTLTDIAMLEGFLDTLGPFNAAGTLNEALNTGDGALMGSWPVVNRVGRFGSFKAAQLREVELTGPYFHNGGKLTLRQVVDFYTRGGDFPVTNANHRDFNIVNLNIEVQSNLNEDEKVALVDFLLTLTDDRVAFERAPFDHPQVILPLDGTAPENTTGRDAMLAGCVTLPAGNILGPGQQTCAGGMFLNVPAVGAAGNPGGRLPNFLGIQGVGTSAADSAVGRPAKRLSGAAAFCTTVDSQYCH